MADRYKVVDGSQSAHCCFDATVVDTAQPEMIGGKQYVGRNGPQFEAVCECFDRADAELIAAALNATSGVAEGCHQTFSPSGTDAMGDKGGTEGDRP